MRGAFPQFQVPQVKPYPRRWRSPLRTPEVLQYFLMREYHDGTGTRLYNIWKKMRGRCQSPTDVRYADYGGRGISVCDEWSKFSVFRTWANANGYEDHLSIDRIDNDGPYSPENCRWADDLTQARNSRHVHEVTAWGETRGISEWAEDPRCAISYDTLKQRLINMSWEPERAITTHARSLSSSDRGTLFTAYGEEKTMKDWARDPRCLVSYQTLSVRLRSGWDVEEALVHRTRRKVL